MGAQRPLEPRPRHDNGRGGIRAATVEKGTALGAAAGAMAARADSVPRQADRGRAQSDIDLAELTRVVSLALQDEKLHSRMLSVFSSAPSADPGSFLSEAECDLGDWGFTFGVAWAAARAMSPAAPDEIVASSALDAARIVFGEYAGDGDWAGRIARARLGVPPSLPS